MAFVRDFTFVSPFNLHRRGAVEKGESLGQGDKETRGFIAYLLCLSPCLHVLT
jgi:hypothetical protein